MRIMQKTFLLGGPVLREAVKIDAATENDNRRFPQRLGNSICG
jgi:hypothetical protein